VQQSEAIEQMLVAILAHFQAAWTIAQQGTLQPFGNAAAHRIALQGFDYLMLAASHPHRAIAIGIIIRVAVILSVVGRFVLVFVGLHAKPSDD